MFFCSFVFLSVTSSVSFTGFYTEDKPNFQNHGAGVQRCSLIILWPKLQSKVVYPGHFLRYLDKIDKFQELNGHKIGIEMEKNKREKEENIILHKNEN